MKRVLIIAVCALAMALAMSVAASAEDMNEYYVACTINDTDYAVFFATSSVSLDDASRMAVAKCGNTPFCREQVEAIERGCIAYAESPDAWGMGWNMDVNSANQGAIDACAQHSQNPSTCKTTAIWCADR